MTDAAIEKAAETLVRYSLGSFEDQRQKEDGSGWLLPPFTPNDRARQAARAAVVAFLRAWEPSEEAGEAADEAVAQDDHWHIEDLDDFNRAARAAARAEADRIERTATGGQEGGDGE